MRALQKLIRYSINPIQRRHSWKDEMKHCCFSYLNIARNKTSGHLAVSKSWNETTWSSTPVESDPSRKLDKGENANSVRRNTSTRGSRMCGGTDGIKIGRIDWRYNPSGNGRDNAIGTICGNGTHGKCKLQDFSYVWIVNIHDSGKKEERRYISYYAHTTQKMRWKENNQETT